MYLMVGYTAEYLGTVFPQHRETFQTRAKKAQEQLEALDAEIETRLAPMKKHPFVMVHDALYYVEQRYGIASVGTIDLSASTLTAMQMKRVHDLFARHKVYCVVYEQGLPEATLQRMLGLNTKRALAAVDVFGNDVALDDAFYGRMMHQMVDALIPCLDANPKPQRSLPDAS
jgi:zinc transport system substrate-binding protein